MLDIGKQLKLAIQALNVLVPIAEEAGIESNPDEAYDEWETITQAIFEAFVVIPISDTTGQYSPDQFHRLGFNVQSGKDVISFDLNGKRHFVFDLCKSNDGVMLLEARVPSDDQAASSKLIPIDRCSNFSVSII